MDDALARLTAKKQRLDEFRPLPVELTANLREWFRVELTYTSNAIEGNTLTRQETALVVDKGISVAGRSVREIFEAVGHARAYDYIQQYTDARREDVTEEVILTVHEQILSAIDPENAGRYRSVPVRIAGSTAVMPNYVKVPRLMAEFAEWLRSDSAEHPATIAAEAHYRLVSIHPFVDGNGRTARLLMNLLLMHAGYPAAIVRPEDRSAYLTALETAQTGGPAAPCYACIYDAVDRSLDIYLESAV
jgi:Fic family protein